MAASRKPKQIVAKPRKTKTPGVGMVHTLRTEPLDNGFMTTHTVEPGPGMPYQQPQVIAKVSHKSPKPPSSILAGLNQPPVLPPQPKKKSGGIF